jgi:cellulose synthase operon protein C
VQAGASLAARVPDVGYNAGIPSMTTEGRRRGTTPGWRSHFRLVAPVVVAAACIALSARPTCAQAAADTQAAPPADLTTALAFLARGQLDDALGLAASLDAPSGAFVGGRVAAVRGRYQDAERLLGLAAEADPAGEAGLELGLFLRTMGRRDEAVEWLAGVVEGLPDPESADSMVRAARAARALGQFRMANGLFRQALALEPGSASVNLHWGELLLEKYNRPEARRSFEAALDVAPDLARAHLGLARVLAGENPPAASAAARRALDIDPTLAAAHVFLAEQALDRREATAANEAIAKALEINPNHLDARSLVAVVAWLEDRVVDFEREVQQVLALNPLHGEVFRATGQHTASRYRFEEAAALVRRALGVDPSNTRARADLGMHLLRTGDEEQARQALDEAFQADPYDVVTFNLLAMFDTLQTFEVIEDADLVVKLHPDEAPVLREHVVPLARAALDDLSARYDITPRGPVLVEVFPRHDDFAVRTLGLPGMIGALGACFGRVVTRDSPRARPPGTFNWAATLWHELAHVVTLQLSNQRVPRWLTEGLSVLEERRARAEWGRESEFDFVDAMGRGAVLPLSQLNAGFSDPLTISLAYFQASLVAEHIVELHGEAAIRRMLQAYGRGLDDAAVLSEVLGSGFEALQGSFDRFLEARYGAMRRALETPEALARQLAGADVETLSRLAAEHPGSFRVLVALGEARSADGDTDGAIDAWRRAAALVPVATGEASPRVAAAELAALLGDTATAASELEAALRHHHTGLPLVRRLAELAEQAGDDVRRRAAAERLIAIDPFDATAYTTLGRLSLGAGEADEAVRQFRLALTAGATDAVSARTDLAEGLLLAGRASDAKREVIGALESAPRYERGLELLLRIVDGAVAQGRR